MADNIRMMTEDERKNFVDFLYESVRISRELEMWSVTICNIDPFGCFNESRDFFSNRFYAEKYISQRINDFKEFGVRFAIYFDNELIEQNVI